MSETGAPTTGVDPTATSTPSSTSSSGGPTSTTSGPDTTSDTGTSGSTTGADDSTTGAVDDCNLEQHADEIAGQLGDFEDCGVVDIPDDASKWQAAHDCALAAATDERAFKLVAFLQGIDSIVGEAYGGQEARSYAPFKLFFDSDPCGGGGCGPVIHHSNCTAITATPNCTVEPGNVCLTCDAQSMPAQICPPL